MARKIEKHLGNQGEERINGGPKLRLKYGQPKEAVTTFKKKKQCRFAKVYKPLPENSYFIKNILLLNFIYKHYQATYVQKVH